jgi:hypothetical protein
MAHRLIDLHDPTRTGDQYVYWRSQPKPDANIGWADVPDATNGLGLIRTGRTLFQSRRDAIRIKGYDTMRCYVRRPI